MLFGLTSLLATMAVFIQYAQMEIVVNFFLFFCSILNFGNFCLFCFFLAVLEALESSARLKGTFPPIFVKNALDDAEL